MCPRLMGKDSVRTCHFQGLMVLTPYRVFIFRSGNLKEGETLKHDIAPTWEKGLRGDPRRLFLSSKSGFMSTELFEYIMNDFAEWWTLENSGLHCFLYAIAKASTAIIASLEGHGNKVSISFISCLDLLIGSRFMTKHLLQTSKNSWWT